MGDLTYDIDAPAPRKPRPIAPTTGVSTDTIGNAIANLMGVPPGFNVQPQSTAAPGMRVPTPMGWLSPEGRMLTHLAPSREAIADTLGIPMDGVAWVARTLGAIP